MNYRERISNFWKWFEQNEEKLADYIDNMREKNYDPDELVAFFSEGLNLAIDGCAFNMGGKREINLTPSGNPAMLFLTSYLVDSMPEKFKGSWNFMPWKVPATGFNLRIHDVSISADDILLSVTEEECNFGIEFYNPTLSSLDEDQAYEIFYIMLDLSLGENIAMAFVNYVDIAEKEHDSMIKLSELRQYMNESVEGGIDDNHNPTDSFYSYGGEPSEDDDTLRFDIIAGFSSLLPIMRDYHNAERDTYDLFQQNGVKAAFLSIARTSEDHEVDLEIRNTILDKIEAEIPSEVAVVIGQAIGTNNTYIDLLLYDEASFNAFLKALNVQHDMCLHDFITNKSDTVQ